MKVIAILSAMLACVECLRCLNSNGQNVDWFSVYKSALIRKVPKFQKGLGFFYLDEDNSTWTLSEATIADSGTPVANTVTQIYTSARSSWMYLLYNDEPPSGTSQSLKGHTKGVVAFDKTSGFWLVHSVPNFPPPTSGSYSWNYNGSKYGQIFLCITFPYSQLGQIAYQLFMNRPHVYDSNIPYQIAADYPLLQQIVMGKRPTSPPWYNVTQLTSLNGQNFLSFAKADEFDKDLYDSLVAPKLQTSLKVETWLNGQGTKLPSDCTSTYKVRNIRDVALSAQANFNETKDHSKWAISDQESSTIQFISEKVQRHRIQSSPWVCVADINRMESQFKRGGGALCLQHQGVWTSFNNAIAKCDSCQP
ncbi:plancitoxin-1-like isoform X2 [Biomphalaria glabrata]|uniref:Plancitoxin-1-like isoform X2 n=1 Tax=Biomphalaria glabrata TaxID=6526 RepID=A0A9W3B8R3_BIOGL|nr:plancitoxin-1-like isoform X2 [Biomphalaria glabrata]